MGFYKDIKKIDDIYIGLLEAEKTIDISAGTDVPSLTATIGFGPQDVTIIPHATSTNYMALSTPFATYGQAALTFRILACADLDWTGFASVAVLNVASLPASVVDMVEFEIWETTDGAGGRDIKLIQTVIE